MELCESCREAFEEEGADEDMIDDLIELGSEIADHLCDEIESDGDIRCICSCHPAAKKRLRARARA